MTTHSEVQRFLDALPAERRAEVEAVRAVILANLDADFEEGPQYGAIGYYVPHRVFPAGYHCDPKQPLPCMNLAVKKGHIALHMMALYGDEAETARFTEGFAKAGKRLDMGKACVRFQRAADLALDVLGDTVKRITAARYLAKYQSVLAAGRSAQKAAEKNTAAKRTTAKNTAAKKTTAKNTAAKRSAAR